VIRADGLVLTIGYLIVEAESVWLTANDGTVVAGHPLAYDFTTGFGLVQGDQVIEVAGERVAELAEFFRNVWRQGPAGTEIRLTLARDGAPAEVRVRSGDRTDFLKKPRLQ
jgi:S1-C subfamily serine protease